MSLIGHDEPWREWRAALASGKMHHGWILTGKRGLVRRMQKRLETRPTLGPRRAVIVDAADDLERNAFNALLKSLEEPPEGTYFLLIVHRLGRLPATIRSRCRTLRFSLLDDAQLAAVLDAAAPANTLWPLRGAFPRSIGSRATPTPPLWPRSPPGGKGRRRTGAPR